MPKKLRAMLPHAAILIANMYIVFFLIDRVNSAMNFIDNGLTKGLLLAMSLIVLADVLLPRPRRPRRRAQAKRAAAPEAPATPEAPAVPETPVVPEAHRAKHAARDDGEAAA